MWRRHICTSLSYVWVELLLKSPWNQIGQFFLMNLAVGYVIYVGYIISVIFVPP